MARQTTRRQHSSHSHIKAWRSRDSHIWKCCSIWPAPRGDSPRHRPFVYIAPIIIGLLVPNTLLRSRTRSMAPRSNKRAKTTPGSRPVDDGSHSDGGFHAPTLTPETLGRKGFLALPDELIYLIFSYYTEIRVEDILINPTYLPGHFLDRFKALKNLSQLCRLSRKTYLPLLWERVQICVVTKGAWYREHGNNLIRKCNGLLKSQYLWPYVRTVTVCLTRFETNRGSEFRSA
ncbi:hypothetical protein RSAG8_09354, partial [Rhizoctonia solani AG-8 WAC10335]